MHRFLRRTGRYAVTGPAIAALVASAGCGTVAEESRQRDEPGHKGRHGPVEFTGGGSHTLLVTDDFPPPDEPTLTFGVAKGPLPHKKNSPVEHDYRIKINARGLEGVADVKLPCDTWKSGYVSVCSGPDFAEVLQDGRTWGIRLAAGEQSEVGDSGEIRITAFGENYHMWIDGPIPVRFEVDVSSGLEATGRTGYVGVRAGDVYRTRMGFTNATSQPVAGAVLRYVGTRGLSFPERYRNCSYGEQRLATDGERDEFRVAVCRFDGPFAADATYRLAEPVAVRAADFALHERFDYRFYPRGHREVPGLDDDPSFRQGGGERLTLEPVPAGTGEEPGGGHGGPLVRNSTYDLALTGEVTSGRAGGTTTVRVVLGNRGPARFEGSPTPDRGSVIPSRGAVVVVDPPEGTVTEVPDGCTAVDKGFREIDRDHKWFHTFACPVEADLLPGETVEHLFRLRLGGAAEGEEVRTKLRFGFTFPDRLETEPANNQAAVALGASGTGSRETPG